jgi:PAS domain S-box-containing protein
MTRRASRQRSWFVGCAGLLLLAFGLVAFGRRVADRVPTLGADWREDGERVVLGEVEPGGPAARAGLEAGDVLLRIDGRPVRSALEASALPWDLPRDRSVPIAILRGERSVEAEVRVLRRAEVPPLYGFLAIVAAGFLVSGGYVLLRLGTVRGATAYGMLAAALFLVLIASPTGRADRLDWTLHAIDLAAGALAPAFLFHLCLTLSRRAVRHARSVLAAAYAPVLGIGLAAIWLEGLGGAHRFEDPALAVAWIDRGLLAFLAVSVVGGSALLARSYHESPSGLHRSQLRWMLWGLGLGLGPFAAAYALPWAMEIAPPAWASLSLLPVLLVPAAFTAAMARYRLHDLDLVLRRGLAGASLAVVVVVTYAVSLSVLRWLNVPGAIPDTALSFLAAVVTAVAYPKLRASTRAVVDRAFYRARYSDRATLLEWARELQAETDLSALLGRLEDRVRDTMELSWVRAMVRAGGNRFVEISETGEDAPLELDAATFEALDRDGAMTVADDGIAAAPDARHAFALRVRGRVTGLLLLPERRSLAPPLSSEDRRLLSTLAERIAPAIEAARVVREVRRHAEEVELLRARQERILESSGVGLLLADGGGRILAWNRRLEEIYGLPRHEAIGRRLADVFPLQTVRLLDRARETTAQGDESRVYGHGLVNAAGRRILVDLSVSGVDRSGEAPGPAVVTFDDVTERNRLEEQVTRQERLASLGLLAAGVAHEVNTPLTGISSYTQMLLDDIPPGDLRRSLLEKIEAQTRRASGIANTLLNLARPDRNAFEPFDLSDAVAEVLRLFEPQVRGRGIRVESELDERIPEVTGNRSKIQQVVLNLLLNARDAVEDGGTIRIRSAAADGRATVEVEDDGRGIEEDDLPRVFDPFFTTKVRGKGTGLGLSISYGIVREHDGEMHVESVPGRFTRFRVDLPLPRSAAASA